jgi:uncharacterized protein with HEPN domain
LNDPPANEQTPNERDAFYLVHMLECIDAIESYCAAASVESDGRTLDSVLRRLQILTESSKRVSHELKAACPDVPWRELAGFRNVVVHDYLAISTERILPIVSRDIPSLKVKLATILAALRPADRS